jgi:hypothetical protein
VARFFTHAASEWGRKSDAEYYSQSATYTPREKGLLPAGIDSSREVVMFASHQIMYRDHEAFAHYHVANAHQYM